MVASRSPSRRLSQSESMFRKLGSGALSADRIEQRMQVESGEYRGTTRCSGWGVARSCRYQAGRLQAKMAGLILPDDPLKVKGTC